MVGKEFAIKVVSEALKKGATDADVVIRDGDEFSISVRLGNVETLKHITAKKLGLRVFVGKRSAITSTANLGWRSVKKLVSDTVTLAKITSEDEVAGLPDAAEYQPISDLELGLYFPDTQELSSDDKIALAMKTEQAAREFDPRITNSEGAEFGNSVGTSVYANSRGFAGEYRGSSAALSVVPVASENGRMQRDYWYSVKRSLRKLDPPEVVGKKAAERVLRRLGARKVKTQVVPVVFDPLTATSLLGHLCEAVTGSAIFRKSSFLVDKLGQKIAADMVNIEDNGRLPEGLGSRPFDGEGLPTRATPIIEGGILQNYLLDTYSARKLGLKSTGNAARGVSGPPSAGPTNFYLKAGTVPPEEIIRSVSSGLYLTEMIGFGVNTVNGDFSQGAVGVWIEGGTLTYAVEEITIASNLAEMLKNIETIGSDLEFRGAIAAPTIKISQMVISGD
jgi:PmbA protein